MRKILLTPGCSALVLALAVAIAYGNTFQGEFIFDDSDSIEKNPSVHKLWPLTQVLWPGVGGRTVDGRPLLNASLAVNYAISGLNVWSYHALNVLIHAAATLVLFGLLRRTLLLPALRGKLASEATGLSLAIALLWGLHPLNTQAVTYVVQRAESMAGLLYLTTLYCVARGEASGRGRLLARARDRRLPGRHGHQGGYGHGAGGDVALPVGVRVRFRAGDSSAALAFAAGAGQHMVAVGDADCLERRTRRKCEAGCAALPARYGAMQLVAVVHYLKLSFSPRPLVLDYGKELALAPAQVAGCALIIALLAAGTVWGSCEGHGSASWGAPSS